MRPAWQREADDHHPTCKGGCGELADECACDIRKPDKSKYRK